MNIFLIILLIYFSDIPELPRKPRADRRASRNRAINHNRRTYHNKIGPGKWFEVVDEEGFFQLGPSWKPSIKTKKPQQGRWATERLSGHRRFAKWSKEYYSSKIDILNKERFDEALKDYFND